MHFPFSLPVVYRPHPLHMLTWLNCPCLTSMQVRISKSWSEFCTSWSASMLCYNGWRACGVCALESSSLYCHPYFNYHFCLVVFCAHYVMDCVFWLLVFLVYTCPGLKCLLIATVLCVHVLVVACNVQCVGFWYVYDYVYDLRLVQYESADSAERALLELQDSLLDGRRLFLRKVCQFQLYHNSSLKEIYGYY